MMTEVTRKYLSSTTHFSPCRRYRYSLVRRWQEDGPLCMFIGLNPSTADEEQDDPTVRRCIGFARQWGYAGLIMGNIFAFRSTDPAGLYAESDPIGSENDAALKDWSKKAARIIAAWGNHGALRQRGKQVSQMVDNLQALRVTGQGEPGHALYLPYSCKPFAYP